MYATHEGKTYLKAVIVNQANAAIRQGKQVTPPPGVVFEPFTEPHLYVVLPKELKFEGRFLVERADGEGAPLHAFAYAVKRIESVPDECPPFQLWKVED